MSSTPDKKLVLSTLLFLTRSIATTWGFLQSRGRRSGPAPVVGSFYTRRLLIDLEDRLPFLPEQERTSSPRRQRGALRWYHPSLTALGSHPAWSETPYPSDDSSDDGKWGVADDWSSLSSENDVVDPESLTVATMTEGRNAVAPAAERSRSPEEKFVDEAVDFITHMTYDASDPPLYDTAAGHQSSAVAAASSSRESFESYATSEEFAEDAANEINLLVRCNDIPEALLVTEGRAMPPLEDAEKFAISQLVVVGTSTEPSGEGSGITTKYEPTDFFNKSVSAVFQEHAVDAETAAGDDDVTRKEKVMDVSAVARWMTKSLGDGEDAIGRHDKRVTAVISRYGKYGSGRLTQDEFHHLYLDAVLAGFEDPTLRKKDAKENGGGRRRISWKQAGGKNAHMRDLKLEQPGVESVWRDFRNHGILPPVEQERLQKQKQLDEKIMKNDAMKNAASYQGFMDECEILEWGDDGLGIVNGNGHAKNGRTKNSHEVVELCSDGETPKRIRDGRFIFIDEESCIGCTQCAQISPSSFFMLDNGRARAFSQSITEDVDLAVSACPVNCMHRVSFHELKEMELSRDDGDGRDDHRHLGRSHTPLNVAGIDSDANHKSSWYHYLKHRCAMSSSCPQRGCYDCPHFSAPGQNPYFKEKHREAERVRAKDIVKSGEADMYRNTADL